MNTGEQFGVVIAGDELLTGKRVDKHLPHVIDTLRRRGMQVAWSRIVTDDRQRLVQEFKLTQLDSIPVLCFGGIGATPDDQTRPAAAEAFGSRLTRHPEAVALIEDHFGEQAYPSRILMADLPEDCLLIPNAYNRIPGFTVYDHHFFPGFPEMAWPMLDWVLDRYYPTETVAHIEKSVRVIDRPESDLLPLLNAMTERHPGVKLFSLPRIADIKTIEVGFRGERALVVNAMASLVTELVRQGIVFDEPALADDVSASSQVVAST